MRDSAHSDLQTTSTAGEIMFKCANDECFTEIKHGMKPVQVATKIRTVGYTEQLDGDPDSGCLVGTGHETVEEVLLCSSCAREAQEEQMEANTVEHKIINKVFNKHGVQLRTEVEILPCQ